MKAIISLCVLFVVCFQTISADENSSKVNVYIMGDFSTCLYDIKNKQYIVGNLVVFPDLKTHSNKFLVVFENILDGEYLVLPHMNASKLFDLKGQMFGIFWYKKILVKSANLGPAWQDNVGILIEPPNVAGVKINLKLSSKINLPAYKKISVLKVMKYVDKNSFDEYICAWVHMHERKENYYSGGTSLGPGRYKVTGIIQLDEKNKGENDRLNLGKRIKQLEEDKPDGRFTFDIVVKEGKNDITKKITESDIIWNSKNTKNSGEENQKTIISMPKQEDKI